MVLYIGIYIESDWLYHAEWVALSNGQSGSELAEYSTLTLRVDRIFQYVGDEEKWYQGIIEFTKADIEECDIMLFNRPYGYDGENDPIFGIMRIWNTGDMIYRI